MKRIIEAVRCWWWGHGVWAGKTVHHVVDLEKRRIVPIEGGGYEMVNICRAHGKETVAYEESRYW